MYLSITGVTADNRLAKYRGFENEADADAHAVEYNGFVVEDPGGAQGLWVVDPIGKTVTRDVDVEEASDLVRAWELLREERNTKLSETDWTQMSDAPSDGKAAWASYRQDLRDLPANTSDPTSPTWPTPPE